VAYRDSFRLLLQFLKKKTGKQPSTLCVDDLDASAILDFLEHLEEQRDNIANPGAFHGANRYRSLLQG
jgi:integrase/recombinase XerD